MRGFSGPILLVLLTRSAVAVSSDKPFNPPFPHPPSAMKKGCPTCDVSESVRLTDGLKNGEEERGVHGADLPPLCDLGTWGATFPIHEMSLWEVIQQKLRALDGKAMQEFQKDFLKKAQQSIHRPRSPKGWSATLTPRSWTWDPSITASKDITGPQGEVIVPKGTTVNPLHHVSWGVPLLIIDGDDHRQVTWALSQEGTLVLVKGSPLEIEKNHGRPVYFDQGGSLLHRFSLTHVPGRIQQKGDRLFIEELLVDELLVKDNVPLEKSTTKDIREHNKNKKKHMAHP